MEIDIMKNTKYKVLFIEDNQLDQMAFKRFVGKNDIPYDCKIASSVSEALQALDYGFYTPQP
jgi:hypothetical protein